MTPDAPIDCARLLWPAMSFPARSSLRARLLISIGLVGAVAGCSSTTTTSADVLTTASSTTLAPTTTVAPTTTTAMPVPTGLPTGASELAAALIEAERAVRGEQDPIERAAWGERQQLLYQVMSVNPEVGNDVVQLTDDDAIRGNYEARLALNALVNNYPISDTLPAWEIREPLPAEALLPLYRAAEDATGIEWEYLAAINLVETRMGRINGVSTAGAVGPMQFLPSTWAECCDGDPTIAADAIMGAGQYLVDRGGPEDMDRAILGYNNSKNYLTAVQSYAAVMRADPDAYFGYHAWRVFFRSSAGLAILPVGYFQAESVDAATWLADHPESLVS